LFEKLALPRNNLIALVGNRLLALVDRLDQQIFRCGILSPNVILHFVSIPILAMILVSVADAQMESDRR